MSLEDRLKRIAEEKERLAGEEAQARSEAVAEIDRIDAEIAALEERKSQLEGFLGLDDGNGRAGHGQIMQLCLKALADNAGGLSSGQIRDVIGQENANLRLSSVPSTLSRLASQGKIRRDDQGRYFLA